MPPTTAKLAGHSEPAPPRPVGECYSAWHRSTSQPGGDSGPGITRHNQLTRLGVFPTLAEAQAHVAKARAPGEYMVLRGAAAPNEAARLVSQITRVGAGN